jgi:hypothetical protein
VGIDPHELVEHPVAVDVTDAGSVIHDLDPHRGPCVAPAHLDRAARRVPQRILEHVHQDDVEQCGVRDHEWQVSWRVQRQLAPVGQQPQPLDRALGRLREVDRLGSRHDGAGADAAHRQHLGDEPLEPVRLGIGGVDQLGRGTRAQVPLAPPQAGERGLDRGERGPEVVGHRREEAGPALIDGRADASVLDRVGELDPFQGGAEPHDERGDLRAVGRDERRRALDDTHGE